MAQLALSQLALLPPLPSVCCSAATLSRVCLQLALPLCKGLRRPHPLQTWGPRGQQQGGVPPANCRRKGLRSRSWGGLPCNPPLLTGAGCGLGPLGKDTASHATTHATTHMVCARSRHTGGKPQPGGICPGHPHGGVRRCARAGAASHRIASHRISSHRISSHRIASHRIASHRIASLRRSASRGCGTRARSSVDCFAYAAASELRWFS